MSEQQRVKVDIDGAVAVVSLNRPDKLNGLDFPMFDGLLEAARSLRDNRQVRVVVLRGEGLAFSAGLDFASVGRAPARMFLSFLPLPWRGTNRFQEVAWAWRRLPMPVIAVLHGRCYGGGLQLALAADFRISSSDCEISMMEAKWGLIPDMTGSVTMAELVGLDVAKRLAMTGEIIDGDEAKALGLVSEVSEDPLERAHIFAAELALRSPDAVAASKRLLNDTRHRGPRAAFAIERSLQLTLLRGANHRIARTAGIAREMPRYVERTLRR
ncbi:MAG TPA: crotonase/enoyl-CoA hydratase family protein [Solirubrobacteraceae bacterium]|nr:crotonase/enoyl-CoA hydratase family protein [Solirubrobacteraceae bacterium]